MAQWIWTLIGVVNLVALLAMGWDKRQAIRGGSRVPERTLFTLAALTGAVGIWAGRALFRHKTIKRSFTWTLVAATAVNGLWVALWWWSRSK